MRFHLKQAGVKTTTLDSDGIETEFGLSTLLGMPEARKVFGEDLTFEVSALLCDAHGPNLRNELAHGLLDEDACQSVYVVYVWQLALLMSDGQPIPSPSIPAMAAPSNPANSANCRPRSA